MMPYGYMDIWIMDYGYMDIWIYGLWIIIYIYIYIYGVFIGTR